MALADPLTREQIFELVKERLQNTGSGQVFVPDQNYYHFGYKTDLPRNQKSLKVDSPWKSEELMYFSDETGRVTQIALIAKKCAVGEKTESIQTDVREQTKVFVSREAKVLFGEEFKIPEDKFRKIGTDYLKWNRIFLDKPPEGVQKARLGSGFYKCDGRSGFGYRVDFFL